MTTKTRTPLFTPFAQERRTMDPNACFQLILDALETDDPDEAREHADDLRNWLRRGGFMPTIQPHELEFLLTCACHRCEALP